MKSFYFAAAAALMLCGCSQDKQAEQAAVVEELPLVELGVASVQDVAQGKSYTASVEADNTNNISPSAPNRIKTITVEVGDHVSKGQTLVTLDAANLEQLRVNLDNVEREYNRAAQLLEIGAGTQQAVDQLKAQLDALRTQYNNLKENTVLVSPISGVVTARNYDPGDMTNGATPVLTVGQITPNVKVMISATENDFSKFKVGTPVAVTFDAYPGETFEGKISRIYPTVNPSTRTFQAEILVANQQGKILPGMFARVNMDFGTESRVVVPDLAVVKQTGSGNRYVYVYNDGRVSMRRVELGQRLGDAYELISGVEDGDSVVVVGQVRLADGVAVQVNR
ncbi:MAG: efflux RND transporter periplasmic adaptor subunit [Muribaculaceae bacterium]|nr:efflux RND transporter periplasmic adaptor subunit [Muribaculaceae bacterium]